MSAASTDIRTAAVLPVKAFERAKQRLGQSVADPLRLALAQAMVADVLLALSRTDGIERTIVVTRERSVAGAAAELGAIVLEDAPESGQSAAALLGIGRALAEGFDRVLCVPGDCPSLDPEEMAGLLCEGPGAGGEPEVVIVPDRHGEGTNGLLLTPPAAIAPSFGPGSCERHLGLAREAGIPSRLSRPRSLLLDIDTGADLAELRERLAGEEGIRAARTRAVLADPERVGALPLSGTG